MLRLFSVITIFLLAACNPFDSNDDSRITLEGTDPNGTSISFVSENGYHAVKLNDQEWVHVNNKIQLDSLRASDTLEIFTLCEKNDSVPYPYGFNNSWIIEYLHKDINEKQELRKECYFKNEYQPLELKTAKIISQQINEGINIVEASIANFDNMLFDPKTNEISLPAQNDKFEHLFFAIAYNKNTENFIVYKDIKFNFNDSETIIIDFYAENAKAAQFDNLKSSGFTYNRDYCETTNNICIKSSFYLNGQKNIKIPDDLKDESGIYTEYWWAENSPATQAHIDSYRYSGKEPLKSHYLKDITSEILPITTNYSYQEIKVVIPDTLIFEDVFWHGNIIQQYEGFFISVFDVTISKNIMTTQLFDLYKLPAIPAFFNKTNDEMISASLMMTASTRTYNTTNNHNISIKVPIDIEQIQN